MNIQKSAEFIKALRKEKNMTQLELANRLSCTDKAVSRWETGKNLPDADTFLQLSDIFGVSVNEILLGERLNLPAECEEISTEENIQSIAEIISSTDETIVDILNEKEKAVSGMNKAAIHLVISCCIQVLIFFAMPSIVTMIKPNAESITLMIGLSVINSFSASFIKSKIKWCFPVFTVMCLMTPILWDNNEVHIFVSMAIAFGLMSAAVMAVYELIKLAVKLIKLAAKK